MSAHKNLIHYLVLGWLDTNGLDDTAENYQAGMAAIMDGQS